MIHTQKKAFLFTLLSTIFLYLALKAATSKNTGKKLAITLLSVCHLSESLKKSYNLQHCINYGLKLQKLNLLSEKKMKIKRN